MGVVPCGPVLGVAGWEWSRIGGDLVGAVQYLGWPGRSGPVLGVTGWEWSRVWGGRVVVVQYWG